MLYDMGFLIFSIFYLPILLFKGRLHKDFLQRFGIFDPDTEQALRAGRDRIWIQAVSVGEVALCKAFIPLLRQGYPNVEIVLSTITRTGNELAKKNFSDSVIVIYFPLDLSFIVRRVIAMIQPKLYIMIETEIWPNVLKELAKNKIPSVLINGRISDRSFGKYALIKIFLKNILGKITLFCMRSSTDSVRIIELGAPKGRVRVTGNMKFDIGSAMNAKASRAATTKVPELKREEMLLVAGSTHDGEEELITEVYKELIGEFPGLRLLIAPRHIDRVSEIEAVIRRLDFEPVRVSALKGTQEHKSTRAQVMILDTIGELNDAYSAAALVFIGGSMVRYGGHNPIEPAVLEKAVIFGPHMFNFKDTASVFLKNNGAIQVSSRQDLFDKCYLLLGDEQERAWLGKNARRVVFENCGASERNMEAIKEVRR